MGKLAGKVAVITGGGSGVGKAVAAAYLAEGAKVVISGRDKAKLDAAATELGGDVLTVRCDVALAAECEALIQSSTRHFGKVDILFNNAGANLKNRTIRELTPEAWDQLIRTNLDGTFYCMHYVLPQMFERRDGVIVNLVSVAGKRANPLGGAAYVASKFGQGGLGMCLSNEERESGVRVSNVYPGEIDTPILAHRPKPVTEEHRAVILKPEDVANAVLFVTTLPPHVSIPELVIKPTVHPFW
ncbi:SDR family oxidoreductase [Limnoglobus roseus]|uniref:NAD(P)-dependent oxidoreductase n=1 Tax=Limnoglobus roseus TaxID=2598579 RepID=A0A5C1A8S3_9BACT|nr:SDR family oxidoreductase [Limnoglobus roseus]QEL14677.1 NAD(P)-dependent oxidoreductase [Limnoglobus roseus]